MNKILVANRGEIALRIMKTARLMGIKTVAVYSEADRNAPHVLFADEAIFIGPSPSSESYLDMDKIIDAAINSNADAIHPGYGFLSENPIFSKKVLDNNIIFIGPNTHAIEIMGSKLAAKEAVKKYHIPMVPGTDNAMTDVEKAISVAEEIGFPVLIKASAGGGGKGMRIVETLDELPEQMERAISEAQSAFGNGSVFIEKYIASPRHIEIQILADTQGNIVHLFERECSIQRRHQKVVEEAPSVIITPDLRQRMGEAAVMVAQACGYVGAGTVEFLLDDQKNFFFLEMNTRLQVEHPVTEMITGIDIVEEQIKIARGQALSFDQADLKINGHAVELRIYAEDPMNDFLPSVGTLSTYQKPSGIGIRLDDGYSEGMEIPIYYDPMIAKLICHGSSRNEAIQIMKSALNSFKIEGVLTTVGFGKFVFNNPHFISGDIDTHFVQKFFSPEQIEEENKDEMEIAAKIALKIFLEKNKTLKIANNHSSEWSRTRINQNL